MTEFDGKSIVVYSTIWCPDCKQVKKYFGKQRTPYVNIDFKDNEPSNAQLVAKLGLKTKAQRQFYDVVEVDSGGFVVSDQTLKTSWPGVFAAGDVRAGATKQAAAGAGATAALMIREYRKLTR